MIEARNIRHSYGNEEVLHGIDLAIEPGSFTVIAGESGSGKTTFLSILSTLLQPESGVLRYGGIGCDEIADMDRFRRENVGFVFQFHYLIDHLRVWENVALAAKGGKAEALAVLERLHIDMLAEKYPNEISGGERQRTAIARAIVNRPRYLFADEPTGNLDSQNSKIVFDLLHEIDATVVVVTHDTSHILPTDRVETMKDGLLC
jgi:ABC-type lipoprotein export system ATPase subunit